MNQSPRSSNWRLRGERTGKRPPLVLQHEPARGHSYYQVTGHCYSIYNAGQVRNNNSNIIIIYHEFLPPPRR